MSRIIGIIIAAAITLLARVGSAEEARTLIDLRLFPFSTDNYEFHDAWDFYPGELLTPDEVHSKTPTRKLSMVAILPREHNLGDLRHGTFHLQVNLPQAASRYTIFFPELRSASRI